MKRRRGHLLFLNRLMKMGVSFVEDLCDKPISNGTDCYWAKQGVQKMVDGSLQWKTPICQRGRKRCRLDDFFQENRELFGRKELIDSLSDERKSALKAFSDVIGLAMNDPAVLLDYRTGCMRLADAIIAVDSLTFKNMFSQNKAGE